MALKDTIFRFVAALFFENPAKGKSFAQLKTDLDSSGSRLRSRFMSGQANPKLLIHVIQIERWGQNRLRSTLQEVPFELDGSSRYAPSAALGWNELRLEFDQTRQATLELVDRLERANPGPVAHNQFGPISVKGWLGYLNSHANIEVQRKLRS
jgi:DinB superfamily